MSKLHAQVFGEKCYRQQISKCLKRVRDIRYINKRYKFVFVFKHIFVLLYFKYFAIIICHSKILVTLKIWNNGCDVLNVGYLQHWYLSVVAYNFMNYLAEINLEEVATYNCVFKELSIMFIAKLKQM